MLKILLIFSFIFTFSSSVLGQRHPSWTKHLYDFSANINDNVAMRCEEVTIEEWLNFIVANNFKKSLFPSNSGLSKTAAIIFEDLKNAENQTYFHIDKQYLSIYYKFLKPTSKLKALIKSDTTGFSLNIPITGITFEQAEKFCDWKENILNRIQKVQIKLSLPSIEIYKQVIANIDSTRGKCAMYNWANCKCGPKVKKIKQNKFQGKYLVDVRCYHYPDLVLYNLQGNAAEMTSTKGIAMGGSFRHTARESFNDKFQEYKKPEDWLGFRYIITLK